MGAAQPEALPNARPAAAHRRRGESRRAATGRRLAVAIHGIEPALHDRCALIRDWLSDIGVSRATLLVVPARDMHPVGQRSPHLVEWLAQCRSAGDEIAQHGLRNQGPRRAFPLASHALRVPRQCEFARLSASDTRRTLGAGWRLMKLAGIEPQGFVAPAYGYTTELRAALDERFDWWADLRGVRPVEGAGGCGVPAIGLSGAGPIARWLSPLALDAATRLAGGDVRLDIHVDGLGSPRTVRSLESALARLIDGRTAVTYGELARG